MVRYRTRDMVQLTREPCACDRSHLRILHIAGRNDDMLIVRGVNIYPSQIEAMLVGFPGIAPHYQLVLTREGSLDRLSVNVEMLPGFTGVPGSVAGEIRHHIRSLAGISCEVTIMKPGDIPRSEGKAVRVCDLRRP